MGQPAETVIIWLTQFNCNFQLNTAYQIREGQHHKIWFAKALFMYVCLLAPAPIRATLKELFRIPKIEEKKTLKSYSEHKIIKYDLLRLCLCKFV